MNSFKGFPHKDDNHAGPSEARKSIRRVFGKDADAIEVYVDVDMDELTIRSIDPDEYSPKETQMRALADLLRRELSHSPKVEVFAGIKYNDYAESTIITVDYM